MSCSLNSLRGVKGLYRIPYEGGSKGDTNSSYRPRTVRALSSPAPSAKYRKPSWCSNRRGMALSSMDTPALEFRVCGWVLRKMSATKCPLNKGTPFAQHCSVNYVGRLSRCAWFIRFRWCSGKKTTTTQPRLSL